MSSQQHPIEAMAFWQTPPAEITEMKAIYDEFAAGNPEQAAKLKRLIAWAGHQQSCDDAYNNTDFSPS